MSKHIISFENVTISQGKKIVLQDVSFTLDQGAFVYLIGRTGTGKSSLLKTLYGDIKLKKGAGTVVDYDLRKLRDRHIPDLRRQLGIVFQDFQLLSDRSVERNLDFVLRATGWRSANKRSNRIVEVLEAVGLTDKLKFLPHQLSGGEQQRIAIARSLLNEPKLILADEPTGNLDPITSEEVMELLHEINGKGTSIMMATHDFDLISKFPKRTLMCEDKKVVEVKKKN
ncbi:MAG: ATP-binding cassette domain-containing protein [Bacteroidota bacterium]|nr:ATP-binding cassette domain-containing protein [Bacteroidota bacterium]